MSYVNQKSWTIEIASLDQFITGILFETLNLGFILNTLASLMDCACIYTQSGTAFTHVCDIARICLRHNISDLVHQL